MNFYRISRTGVFYKTEEIDFIDLPCVLRSDHEDSNWRVEAHDDAGVRIALELRCAEPDARFIVEEVLSYILERPGERDYSGFFPPSRHDTRGALYEGFLTS
ncbi:hypothetical protein C8D95_108149 [Silicimonas algicola]|uniref:Uncharacterized protein n=1 Tax=Silicimonas algicola TaxID=1826607 RepID=A0A316G657_9RHOB|nr:hypothetical protein C8D95_108149 [Silicimonas algicola]